MASVYLNLPTLNVDFLKPKKASFNSPGGGLEGPRNGLGFGGAVDVTGGGLLTAQYLECFAQQPEEHGYINLIAARMNGSVRLVNVPILTDWIGPFPLINGIPTPIVSGIPHSDGSTFSDGSGYSQATVFATLAQDAAVGAGEIVINLYNAARPLSNWRADWFSIYHRTKMGNRAFRNWDTSDPTPVSETVDGVLYSGQQYTIAIAPALREATTAGTRIELARPRCVMRFPSGFSLPWGIEGFYVSRSTMEFIEA